MDRLNVEALYPEVSNRGRLRSSSARALEVMAFFASTGRPARATEISRSLGVPNSTLDRILKALTRQGDLSFDRFTKLYSPTYKLVRMASAIENAFFGGDLLRRLIADLHHQTGCTVGVFVENDCWAQCVASVPGAHFDPLLHGEGIRARILGSAPGNALMSLKPDAAVLAMARYSLDRKILPEPLDDFTRLIELMGKIRRRGFSAWRGFSFPGATAVYCPIRPGPKFGALAIGLVAENRSGSDNEELRQGQLLQHVARAHGLNP